MTAEDLRYTRKRAQQALSDLLTYEEKELILSACVKAANEREFAVAIPWKNHGPRDMSATAEALIPGVKCGYSAKTHDEGTLTISWYPPEPVPSDMELLAKAITRLADAIRERR